MIKKGGFVVGQLLMLLTFLIIGVGSSVLISDININGNKASTDHETSKDSITIQNSLALIMESNQSSGEYNDIYGCTDILAKNYYESANIDDNSCQYYSFGCTDSTATNYDRMAEKPDGTCQYSNTYVYGCMDSGATNYNSSATISDDTCQYSSNPDVPGCRDATASNYNSAATVDDGSCQYSGFEYIYGCMDSLAKNFNLLANTNDGSCLYDTEVYGCKDESASNFNPSATVDDGSCQYSGFEYIYGCMDNLAKNFNLLATISDGSCLYDTEVYGCKDESASNFNPSATVDDGTCLYEYIYGCMDNLAKNFNLLATISDGSCLYDDNEDIYGCKDRTAKNFNSEATIEDGSCEYLECKPPKKLMLVKLTRYGYPGDPTGGGTIDTNDNNLIGNGKDKVGSAATNLDDIPAGSIIETSDGLTMIAHDHGPDVDSHKATTNAEAKRQISKIYEGIGEENVDPTTKQEYDAPVIDVYDPDGELKEFTGKWTWVCVLPGNAPEEDGSPKLTPQQLKDLLDKAKGIVNDDKSKTSPSNGTELQNNQPVEVSSGSNSNTSDRKTPIVDITDAKALFDFTSDLLKKTIENASTLFTSILENKPTAITKIDLKEKKEKKPFNDKVQEIYGCTSQKACNYNPKATSGYDSCIFCDITSTSISKITNTPQDTTSKYSLADIREAVVQNTVSLQEKFNEEEKYQESVANNSKIEKIARSLMSLRFWKSKLMPNSCNPYFKETFSEGDFDSEIADIIAFLNSVTGKNLIEGPGYDEKVVEAVKEFQTMFFDQIVVPSGLDEPNGQWDKITKATANEILGCGEKVKTEIAGRIKPIITKGPSETIIKDSPAKVIESFNSPTREVVIECRTNLGAQTYRSDDNQLMSKISTGNMSACNIYDSIITKQKRSSNCVNVDITASTGRVIREDCMSLEGITKIGKIDPKKVIIGSITK